MANSKKPTKVKTPSPKKNKTTYVNIHRSTKGYKDKYRKDVENAIKAFVEKLGKKDETKLTKKDWKKFFKTVLIPLDKESEKHMIDLFKDDREELNNLLILHNTLASNNLAEVYFKKYEKECPTHWHDLEDFRQMALEGLAIAAQRFDISSGNKFITYATWWVLNRVRKPYQEKGAMNGHTSFSSPTHPFDAESTSTIEDVFNSSMVSPDYNGGELNESTSNPVNMLDRKTENENLDLFSELKKLKSVGNLDETKAKDMASYLMSIVERNKESYGNTQIFLYIFRKIFNKCSSLFPRNGIECKRLNSYVNEAAKSKAELLKRLKVDEKEYNVMCQALMRGGYDGI